jgi:methylase of polypeptide subunit release factors
MSISDPKDSALLHLGQILRESGYKFTTVTPATHERVNARPENALAKDLAGVFGWSRPFKPEILPPELWRLMCEAEIAISEKKGVLRSSLRLSSLGNQLFWHSSFPTSAPDSVFFGPDTYRFASAIQTALDNGLENVQRAVDICCGAGPGAMVIAAARPDSQVFALDINDSALRLARINAVLNEIPNFEAKNSDLLRDVEGDFDLIVANPPYLVDPSERAYRHGGGPLGAGLSLAIVDAALERLAPGGTLLLYTGAAIVDGKDPFRAAIEEKFADFSGKWHYREVDPDVFGEELCGGAYIDSDRIAAVVVTVTK